MNIVIGRGSTLTIFGVLLFICIIQYLEIEKLIIDIFDSKRERVTWHSLIICTAQNNSREYIVIYSGYVEKNVEGLDLIATEYN